MIADPEWPRKAREGCLDEIVPCIACNQGCFHHIFTAQPVGCLMNPSAGHEGEYRLDSSAQLTAGPAAKARRVMVIGGGPAGMEAALTAAARGHQVTLYEKGEQLNWAAVPPGRKEFETAIRSLAARLVRRGVEVELGQEVTLDLVRDLVQAASPDAVVVATGARPAVLEIPGGESEHVVQAVEMLEGEVDVGGGWSSWGVGPCGELYLIGDTRSPRKAYEAIHEGFRVGMERIRFY